jgi:hypothetical protein
MKTARLLFTLVGLGAFTLVVDLTAEPSTEHSGRMPRENHPANVRSVDSAHGSSEQIKPNLARSSQPGPLHTQIKRTWGNEFHQSLLKKAATAANSGRMMNKIENHHEPLAKLPGYGGTTAPGPGPSRSRSTTLAVLGGLTTASAKNSMAALNGAAMKRKP